MASSRILFLSCLALGLVSSSAFAQAGGSAVAQALFEQGKKLMVAGKATEACPKFEASENIEPRSGTLINLASCYEQAGRLASAWSTYIQAATASKESGNSEREGVARQRAASLASRLSTLTIRVAQTSQGLAGLQITRDGIAVREPEWGVGLPSDPGEHEIRASAPGHEPFQTKAVVAGEASTTTVTVPELVALATAPAAAPPIAQPEARSVPPQGLGTQRIAAIASGGLGVVAIGVGTVFGLSAKSKHDEAAKYCSADPCADRHGVSASESAVSDGDLSTVSMIIGGMGVAGGVVLWLTAPKTTTEAGPSAALAVGPGTLRLLGAF